MLTSATILEMPLFNKAFDTDQFREYVESGSYLPHEIKGSPIHRIDDSVSDDSVFENFDVMKKWSTKSHYTMANYNITAQDGLFILNAYPFKPLEEAILDRIHSPVIKRNEDDPVNEWEKKNKENF